MSKFVLDNRVLGNASWWHWALTVPLLAAHVAGVAWAIEAALVICGAMMVYFLLRIGGVRPFPVQVRVAYFVWLLVGIAPGMGWMHYVALAGTTAMVSVGYCPLARMLGLFWFNRTEPLTLALVKRLVVSPASGGLFVWRSTHAAESEHSCSLRCQAQSVREQRRGQRLATGQGCR